MRYDGRLVGSILLIAGTAIGAGMLALPVLLGELGFLPAWAILALAWLVGILPSLFLLEVHLRMRGESNFVSMIRLTLGKTAEVIAWVIYLLLFYALLSAYTVGSGAIVASYFPRAHGPTWLFGLPIMLVMGSFVFFGAKLVDQCNRLLMVLLFVCYFLLIGFGLPSVQPQLLTFVQWKGWFATLPLVATSFGYQNMIPTLSTYLHHNPRKIVWAIVIGSALPFFVYLLWTLLALGVLSPDMLALAKAEGVSATVPLQKVLGRPSIALFANGFALFAILTSVLGIALALFDFLADGLRVEKSRGGRILLFLLVLIPPFCFTILIPNGFIRCLEYAGLCCAVLLGIYPALMALRERRMRKRGGELGPLEYKAPGGWLAPILVILFYGAIIVMDRLG